MTALDDYRAVAPVVTRQEEVARNATSTVPCGINDTISWICYFETPLPVEPGVLQSLGVLRKSDNAFVEFGVECEIANGYRFGYQNWNPAGSFEERESSERPELHLLEGSVRPWVGMIVPPGRRVRNVLHMVMTITKSTSTWFHRLFVNGTEATVVADGTFFGNGADWQDWLTDETVYFRAGDGTFDGSATTGTIWTRGYKSPPANLITREVTQHGRELTSTERTDLYNASLLVDWSNPYAPVPEPEPVSRHLEDGLTPRHLEDGVTERTLES